MFHWLRRNRGRKVARPVRARRARLMVQGLEGRVVPATFTVLNANDAGPGSLRQIIVDANANGMADDINFAPTTFTAPRSIVLTAALGQLTITGDTTINSPGADLLTVNGNNVTRVFNVDGPGTFNVTLRGMTVTGGNGTNGGAAPGFGGSIRAADENLTLENMVVTDAAAGTSDGVVVALAFSSTPLLTVRNTTISDNQARNGGGVFFSGGSLLMQDSTLSGNIAQTTLTLGGGLYLFGPSPMGVTIRNSTIANNITTGSGGAPYSTASTAPHRFRTPPSPATAPSQAPR